MHEVAFYNCSVCVIKSHCYCVVQASTMSIKEQCSLAKYITASIDVTMYVLLFKENRRGVRTLVLFILIRRTQNCSIFEAHWSIYNRRIRRQHLTYRNINMQKLRGCVICTRFTLNRNGTCTFIHSLT